MKLKPTVLFLSFLGVLSLLTITAVAEVIKVDQIKSNPGFYDNKIVTIQGIVSQYMPGTATDMAYYIVKCDWGGTMQVNTIAGAPETNEKYQITGVVYLQDRQPYLHEQSRSKISGGGTENMEGPAISTNTILLILMAVVILGGLLYFMQKKKGKQAGSQPGGDKSGGETTGGNKPGEKKPGGKSSKEDFTIKTDEDNTIKVEEEYFTLKALPCHLTILSGDQANKVLDLYGNPTPDGVIVTIGRDSSEWKDHVKPGRENAHLRITDSTRNLSRMQAELLFKDDIMILKNLGSVNPTKVDGASLAVNDTVKLKSGSIIQAGRFKMKFEME